MLPDAGRRPETVGGCSYPGSVAFATEIPGSAAQPDVPLAHSEFRPVGDIPRQGGRFEGKIEGLTLHRRHASFARFVIDDDDEDLPSVLFEAELSDGFLRGQTTTS